MAEPTLIIIKRKLSLLSKTDYSKLYPPREPSRKEKAQKRELARREELRNRASNSKDPLLFDVFLAIENELPGSVLFVNETRDDPFLGKPRELDIITKKCLIEIKTGKASRRLKQLQGQQQYAKHIGKQHVLYAPDIHNNTFKDYEKNGITIKKTINELLQYIKEYEK